VSRYGFVDQEREGLHATAEQGDSKEKAARIANASAARGSSSVGRKGGKSGSYDGWAVPELKKRAKRLGISGYSGKRKSELVSALRNY